MQAGLSEGIGLLLKNVASVFLPMSMMHNYHNICHFNQIFHPVIRRTGAEKQQMANSPVRLLRLLQCSSLSVHVSIGQDKMAAQRMSYQSCKKKKKVQSVVLKEKNQKYISRPCSDGRHIGKLS